MIDDLSIVVVQHPEDRTRERRLSGSGFADDAEDFSFVHGEADVLQHGLALLPGERTSDCVPGAQVLHFQDRFLLFLVHEASYAFSCNMSLIFLSLVGMDAISFCV